MISNMLIWNTQGQHHIGVKKSTFDCLDLFGFLHIVLKGEMYITSHNPL